MTKAEAAIIMAYTGERMLSGTDMIMFQAYVKAITGVSFTLDELQVYVSDDKKTRAQKRKLQKLIRKASRGDFLNICQHLNYGYTFRNGKPLSKIIRSVDE